VGHGFVVIVPDNFSTSIGSMGGPHGGATTGGNAPAWADRIREVMALIDKYPGPKKRN
jgi:hypothetical protein